jgi:hypothetical protein
MESLAADKTDTTPGASQAIKAPLEQSETLDVDPSLFHFGKTCEPPLQAAERSRIFQP